MFWYLISLKCFQIRLPSLWIISLFLCCFVWFHRSCCFGWQKYSHNFENLLGHMNHVFFTAACISPFKQLERWLVAAEIQWLSQQSLIFEGWCKKQVVKFGPKLVVRSTSYLSGQELLYKITVRRLICFCQVDKRNTKHFEGAEESLWVNSFHFQFPFLLYMYR